VISDKQLLQLLLLLVLLVAAIPAMQRKPIMHMLCNLSLLQIHHH
jgi:hypothetical protein